MYPKPLQPSQLCRPQWQQVQVDVNTQELSYVFWNHGNHGNHCNCNNLMETTATFGASTATIWWKHMGYVINLDSVATMATTMTTTAKSWWKTRVKSCIPKPLRPLQPLQPQRRQFDGNIIWVELCIPKSLELLQPRHNGNSLMETSSGLSHPFRIHCSDKGNNCKLMKVTQGLSHDSIPKDHLATNGNCNNLMKHMDRVMISETIVTIVTWLRLQRPGERTTSRRTHHHEFWAWYSKHI